MPLGFWVNYLWERYVAVVFPVFVSLEKCIKDVERHICGQMESLILGTDAEERSGVVDRHGKEFGLASPLGKFSDESRRWFVNALLDRRGLFDAFQIGFGRMFPCPRLNLFLLKGFLECRSISRVGICL